jgi:hypothetical protein
MGMVILLVVIDQFDIHGIRAFKAKDDPPICADCNGPVTLEFALQRVKMIPREIKVLWTGRRIENHQNPFDRIEKVRPNPASITQFVKSFQPSVLEALDHVFSLH